MSGPILLFILRLISAAILFGFLAAVAWLVYQDLRRSAVIVMEGAKSQGHLRVLQSESDTAAAGTVFPLLPITRLGRAESNTIVLEDAFVSAEHAQIRRREGQWWLEDLNSRNGTMLNEFPVEVATIVSSGDIITIGSVKLKIEPAGIPS